MCISLRNHRPRRSLTLFAASLTAAAAQAAGTLKPVDNACAPPRILDHDVNVVINNGFAVTEVVQSFHNPNNVAMEAIYWCPVPQNGCLSDVTIEAGGEMLNGEVLTKAEADRIYGIEKDEGNEAGKAEKNGFEDFKFYVANVPPKGTVQLRYLYYEPLEIDAGVGRYVYPLESGGNDAGARRFWSNEKVDGTFRADITLKTAWPIQDVRVPELEDQATITPTEDGYHALVEVPQAELKRDLVFYYRLEDDLPGRVELIAYKPDAESMGTFMLIVTPGLDLQDLPSGADYLFVLDRSGSMQPNLRYLAAGVSAGLGQLKPQDRFRVVTFANDAHDLTGGWRQATSASVNDAISRIGAIAADGSTNLYAGLEMGIDSISPDRATSVVLVTDAVGNIGTLDPPAFHALLRQYDVRFFGFLMGNQSNWPLMRSMAEASGGFYRSVCNCDDITGQILLAKSKLTGECLHDVKLEVDGVRISQTTDRYLGKVFRGQQLVLFGRYEKGGPATLRLNARMTGEDETYTTTFDFPEVDRDHPELERLWAMQMIHSIDQARLSWLISEDQAKAEIEKLGVEYQLVTDHTSMVVLSDAQFARHGLERRNLDRVAIEQEAQATRAQQAARPQRVDEAQPMFNGPANTIGNGRGGGAFGPLSALLVCAAAWAMRRANRLEGNKAR